MKDKRLEEIPLEQHFICESAGMPPLEGKVVQRAVWINYDKKVRIYFEDGSWLSVSPYVEQIRNHAVNNLVIVSSIPAYFDPKVPARPEQEHREDQK